MQGVYCTQKHAEEMVEHLIPMFRIRDDESGTIVYHEYGNAWKPVAVYYQHAKYLSVFDKYV